MENWSSTPCRNYLLMHTPCDDDDPERCISIESSSINQPNKSESQKGQKGDNRNPPTEAINGNVFNRWVHNFHTFFIQSLSIIYNCRNYFAFCCLVAYVIFFFFFIERLLHLLYRNQGDRTTGSVSWTLNLLSFCESFDPRRVSSPIWYSSNDGSRKLSAEPTEL